jgi:serine-type D-Ala-D-Ala carboxypeptidase (penicillin-binding protein 5/6)
VSAAGPPPVPPSVPPPQPFPPRAGVSSRRLRRRRRRPRLLATLALLVAPIVVAAAAYLAFASSDDESRGSPPAPPLAVGGPAPPAAASEHAPPAEPREPAPFVPAEPVPAIPLSGVDAFHVRMKRPPRAGLVFDLDTGDVLWRRRPLRAMPMASLTKIMTALLVVERTRPDEPVRITPAALRYSGSGVGLLPKGKRVRLETLMNGLLLVSGNDAAIALAVHISGTERRFVNLMNRLARRWRLRCTHFASSHGLERGNRSCPRDLAVLTRMAMAEPRIRRIARRRQVSFRFPIKGRRLYLTGHNPLIRMGYRGAVGLKTGYTTEAGRCFVGVARRGGRRMGVVLLNSHDPSRQAPRLLDAAFARSRAG